MMDNDVISSLQTLRAEFSKNLVEQRILCEKNESLLMKIREEVHKLHMQRLEITSRIIERTVCSGIILLFAGIGAGFFLGWLSPLHPFDEKSGISSESMNELRIEEPLPPAVGYGRIADEPARMKEVPLEKETVSPELEVPKSTYPAMEKTGPLDNAS